MNVAIVINKIDNGGVATSFISLINELNKDKNIHLDLYIFSRTNDSRFNLPENINVIYPSDILDLWFESPGKAKGFRKIKWFFVKGIGLKISMRPIETIAIKGKKYGPYDIAISFVNDIESPHINFMANDFVANRILATKKLSWIHNDPVQLGFSKEYCIERYKGFDKIVNVSYGNKMKFDSICPELVNKSEVVYNCVYLMEKMDYADKLNVDGRFHIVSVSRLDNKQKRIDRMIDVCKLLNSHGLDSKYIWHMYGDGKDEQFLRQYATKIGVDKNFVFEGRTDRPIEKMSQSDLYVMTSDYEGYPLTILEALISNVPVVVTDFDEAKESVIDQKNGFIVEKDISKIAKKINECITNKDLLQNMIDYIQKNPVNNKMALDSFYDLVAK